MRVKTAWSGVAKKSAPFEEERPLLGEEEGEARVDVELRGVGLDLREVGVDGGVEGQVRGDAPARREARLGLLVAGLEVAAGEAAGARVGAAAPVTVGSSSRLRPGSMPAKPVTLFTWQSMQLLVAVGAVRGDAVADAARIGAEDVEAPGLRARGAREAELAERDRDLDDVAARR